MDAVQIRLLTLLKTWNEDSPTITTKEGSKQLITTVALSQIVHITPKELEPILSTMEANPENTALLEKIQRFTDILTIAGSSDLKEVERSLGLQDWNAGPNTQIAKDRIISCYLLGSRFLDLNDLHLSGPLPPCIQTFSHLFALDCEGNNFTELTLPDSLEALNCCDNPRLESISGSFKDIEVLIAFNCPHLIDYPKPIDLPKIEIFVSDHETAAPGERWLRLMDWNAGPNTQIAKDRILECFESGSTELDLSGLNLTKFPPHLSRLGLTKLDYRGNPLSRVPKDFPVENLIL